MKIETVVKLNRFVPRPYQKKICDAFEVSGYKKLVIVAPRRMGKDVVAFNLMIRAALERVGLYFYLLPTAVQARRVLFEGMTSGGKKFLDFIPDELIKRVNMQQMLVELTNDSIIQFVGSENFDSLRGTNPVGCVFSEHAYQHPQAYPTIRPILLANDGWAIFISTPFGENHFYTLYKIAQANPKEWYSCLLTVRETQHIQEEEIQREIDSGEMSTDLAQQEYYCSFATGAIGSYYAKYLNNMEFNHQLGTVDWEPNFPVNSAWDLGMRDSTVILFFQTISNAVHVIDMYQNSGVGLEHYINVLQAKPYTWGRHFAPHDIAVREFTSGGLTRLEKASRLGLKFSIAPNLSIIDGIESVRTTLPRMYIDEVKCKTLISAIRDYRKEYDTKLKVYKNHPLHDHNCFTGNHCVLTDKGEVPIKDIRIGDIVITPTGKRTVLNIFKKTVNSLSEVSIGNKKILCTSTHEFFTQRGIVKTDALRYNDVVEPFSLLRSFLWRKISGYCIRERDSRGFKKIILSQKMKNKSCLMDMFIDGTRQNTTWERVENLEQLTQEGQFIRPCSDIYGKALMAQYQKGMWFITRIGTQKTMISRIWRFLRKKSMDIFTPRDQTPGRIVINAKSSSRRTLRKQKNGTEVLKESNGIEVMPKQAFLRAWVKDIVRFVLCAVKNILPSKHGKSIVVMLVKQEREFAIGLTLKKGIVLFAIKSLNVIDMLLKKHAVKNVRTFQPDTPREVYDIEVEHDHCYYIDGSLVSNSHACDALRYLCLSLPKLRNVSDPVLLEQRYNEARYGSSTNLPKMFQDNLPPY